MATRRPKKAALIRQSSGARTPASAPSRGEVMAFKPDAQALAQVRGLFDPSKVKGQALAVAQGGVGWPLLSPRAGMFSLKRQMLGKVLDVVIFDYAAENIFYDKPFNPQQQTSPACQAVGLPGQDWSTLAPPASHKGRIAEKCSACAYAEWGSAAKHAKDVPGKTVISDRAKLCGNYIRIALVNGSILTGGTATPAIAKIAPTSTKAFDLYLRRLVVEGSDETVHYPPWVFLTRVAMVGGVGNAPFGWDFEPLRILTQTEVEATAKLRGESVVELARLQLQS